VTDENSSGGGGTSRRAIEAVSTGLAFASLLCWATAAVVGSFRPAGLPAPYWQAVPWLRTDTLGVVAFLVTAGTLPVSEYLRLRRRRTTKVTPPTGATGVMPAAPGVSGTGVLAGLAIAETVAVLATGVVGYLSVNAVVHPQTLLIQVTHLLPWPSEGTLRVAALILCFGSVTVARFLRSAPAMRTVPACGR
jgi:hypothetical protein